MGVVGVRVIRYAAPYQPTSSKEWKCAVMVGVATEVIVVSSDTNVVPRRRDVMITYSLIPVGYWMSAVLISEISVAAIWVSSKLCCVIFEIEWFAIVRRSQRAKVDLMTNDLLGKAKIQFCIMGENKSWKTLSKSWNDNKPCRDTLICLRRIAWNWSNILINMHFETNSSQANQDFKIVL